MQRTTTLRPLGLITQPNKHGQYPNGAMSVAANVVMRSPGVVEPAKAGTSIANAGYSDPWSWKRLWKYSDSIFLAYGDSSGASPSFAWSAAGGAFTLPTLWDLALTGGGAHGKSAVRVRDRMLIAAPSAGVIIADSTSATTTRMAGLPPMQQVTIAIVEVAGAFLAAVSHCNYRVVVTRKQSDGYLIQSPPSYAVELRNLEAALTAYGTLTFQWADDGGAAWPFQAGDVIEVYRTVQQLNAVDPGETYRLATTHTLTSAEVTARSASVSDTTLDDDLGAELYTNPGQQGATQANYPPATASDLATFKGYTFAITPTTARKFQIKPKANADITVSGGDAVNGIGRRRPTADTTNTNATLTNVSSTAGVVAGQRITGTGIPANTLVVSKTATTIVMSAAATATNAGITVTITDVIEVGGDLHPIGYGGDLIDSIRDNASASYGWNVTTDGVVRFFDGGEALGYFAPNGAETIVFQRPYFVAEGQTGDATFRATNGANYIPALPELSATAKTAEPDTRNNRLTFSKLDQPEAWPLVSELLVGNGTLHRIVATSDVLYVFASDGTWRVTGGGPFASDWDVRQIDSALTIVNPLAADAMGGSVWAYTSRGLVAITYDSVEEISAGIIGDVLPGIGATTTSNASTFLTCDPVNHEARLTLVTGSGVTHASTAYIFNTVSKAFTTQTGSGQDSATAAVLAELFLPTYGVIWSTSHDAASGQVWRPSDATYRTDAEVRFQPITGDGSPFTLKQWGEYEFLFRSVGGALTIDATVNGSVSSSGIASTTQNSEVRFVSAPGLDDAMAPSIALGFTPETAASSGWQWIGMSARYSMLSPQVQR